MENSSSIALSRRSFLAGIGAFALLPSFGEIDIAPKSSFSGAITGRRLKMASIGCGGMGGAATESLIATGCDLVAVCDVNPTAFDRWEQKYPGIPKFTDYRLRQWAINSTSSRSALLIILMHISPSIA